MNWNTIEIKIASAERSQVLHWQLLLLTSDWITSLIEFLGDKLLCGHVPDPFPRCGTGSGHVRLVVTMLILYSIQSPATQSFFPPLSCTTPSQRAWQALKLTNYWRYVGTRPLCYQANFTVQLHTVLLVLRLISLSVVGCCGLCIPTCLPYITSFVVKYQVFPSSYPASVKIVWSDPEGD